MEKTHIAAIVSLILAVALNIASLVDQEWIYISTPEYTTIGLFTICVRDRLTSKFHCRPVELSLEWSILFVLVIGSGLMLLVTICVMCLSIRMQNLQIPCKVLSVITLIIFCSATLLFPVGFHIPAIRGQPYRLPSNAYIGRCFPLFIAANFLTFVGTLLAHRTICQMFSYDQSDQQLV